LALSALQTTSKEFIVSSDDWPKKQSFNEAGNSIQVQTPFTENNGKY